MDSRKDSASLKNSINVECDSEKNRNYKGSPRQPSASENTENLLTSTPNQSSSFVPLNGPRARLANPLSNNDVGHSSAQAEASTDGFKNLPSTSQSQVYKVNPATETETTPSSSSKASSSTYDNGTESNQDVVSCQKHKVCQDLASNSCSVPSTSGMGRSNDTTENSAFRENRKRPSTLKLNRSNLDADESSSDTGNDDYSLGSEDGCIYTYRGGEHLADLPSSFFSLDMGLPLDKHLPMPPNYPVPQQGNREHGSRASSPDMDFLEMDFDPGPSCEVDSGEESPPDADLDLEEANMPEENEPVLRRPSPEYVPPPRYVPMIAQQSSASTHNEPDVYSYSLPSTSQAAAGDGEAAETSQSYGPYIMHVNARGEQILVRRTMSHWPQSMSAYLHASGGDLISPKDMLNCDEEHTEGPFAHQINQGERPSSSNLTTALYHNYMAKKLLAENKPETETQATGDASSEPTPSVSGAACVEPPRCMIWSEREACERQVTQIGPSACGATAVVNVFIALGVPVNVEKINAAVGTRQRANNAPLPRYLLSRAVAGCTAADLVTGIHRASDGLVTARFFPTYPERAVSLSHWLADWISLGAVPILTLNLQAGCECADAWHHQMVFGVSARGVCVCNPLARVRESALWPRLTSPPVLRVRAADVLAHFTPHTDLTPLAHVPDARFHSFNVLGQVANVIRECRAGGWAVCGGAAHVRVPAAYQPGLTLAALTGSDAHRRLLHAPQLPLLAHAQTKPHTHPA